MKRISTTIICIILLFVLNAVPVHANSAQSSWRGISSTGTIIADEDCPLMVEKERLTFDIQEFPANYYDTVEEYLAYTGKVTAEYTFYNPAEYAVTATLVFPFGKEPDYGYRFVSNTDVDKYGITVDGEEIEMRLRHTLSDSYYKFELDKDLKRLIDGYVEDDFYRPDLPVTKYTYRISGIDEKYNAATAAFEWSGDKMETKILLEEQSGGKTRENGVLANMWAENGEKVILYMFGESQQKKINWTFYENGACENKIGGKMTLENTETMTFRDFALTAYDENSGILESDWYNAMVAHLNQSEWAYGVISEFWGNYDISQSLLRWYEYEITVEPGARIVNTVTAPIYPFIDIHYKPAIYGYTYLLSPAQSWAEFGALVIIINTPYYMMESGIEGFIKTENGYTIVLDDLPEGELEFTLCSSETPREPIRSVKRSIPINIIMGGVVLLIWGAAIAFIFIYKKRKQVHMKKKKVVILVVIVAGILLTPIPTGQYKDGGTREYTALTYKIVKWQKFVSFGDDSDGRYSKLRIYPFPMNFLSYESLWEREELTFDKGD